MDLMYVNSLIMFLNVYVGWGISNLKSSKDLVGALVRFVEMFVRPPLGQGARWAPEA